MSREWSRFLPRKGSRGAGGSANLCIGLEASVSQVLWSWFKGTSLRFLFHLLPGLEAPRILDREEAMGKVVA